MHWDQLFGIFYDNTPIFGMQYFFASFTVILLFFGCEKYIAFFSMFASTHLFCATLLNRKYLEFSPV